MKISLCNHCHKRFWFNEMGYPIGFYPGICKKCKKEKDMIGDDEVIQEAKDVHGKLYHEYNRLKKENERLIARNGELHKSLEEQRRNLNMRIRNLSLDGEVGREKRKVYDSLQSMSTYLLSEAEKFR